MRGRQINFFVMPDEWGALEDYLKENNMISIARKMDNNIIELSSLKDKDAYKYFIVGGTENNLKIKHIDENIYFIDIHNPVIEFIRPRYFENKNTLKYGRLYYTKGSWSENEDWKGKNDLFLNSAEALFKWFRKKYKTKTIPKYKGYLISKKVKENIETKGLILNSN